MNIEVSLKEFVKIVVEDYDPKAFVKFTDNSLEIYDPTNKEYLIESIAVDYRNNIIDLNLKCDDNWSISFEIIQDEFEIGKVYQLEERENEVIYL